MGENGHLWAKTGCGVEKWGVVEDLGRFWSMVGYDFALKMACKPMNVVRIASGSNRDTSSGHCLPNKWQNVLFLEEI